MNLIHSNIKIIILQSFVELFINSKRRQVFNIADVVFCFLRGVFFFPLNSVHIVLDKTIAQK